MRPGHVQATAALTEVIAALPAGRGAELLSDLKQRTAHSSALAALLLRYQAASDDSDDCGRYIQPLLALHKQLPDDTETLYALLDALLGGCPRTAIVVRARLAEPAMCKNEENIEHT